MELRTNMSKEVLLHDPIAYASIESQVLGLFHGMNVKYEIKNAFMITVDAIECSVEINRKGVRISMMTPYDERKIQFGEEDYPSVKLAYNTDITKKVMDFRAKIDKISALTKEAKKVIRGLKKADYDKIEKFLNQELATNETEVRAWFEHGSLFSGVELTFFIHPKGQAPADGVLLCLESTGDINPFWNGSTKRRTLSCSSPEKIEDAVGKRYGYDVASMKKKIEAVEALQEKIRNFNPSKSPEFMELLKRKKQADELLVKFQS